MPTRQSVLARLSTERRDGQLVADRSSELVLMEIAQPWGNHNGGTILFGPDRMLYVALGDGGAADDRGRNGQNLATLLATVNADVTTYTDNTAVPSTDYEYCVAALVATDESSLTASAERTAIGSGRRCALSASRTVSASVALAMSRWAT